MELNFVATCLFGLEGLLGQEIDDLGCKRTETIDGRIYFAYYGGLFDRFYNIILLKKHTGRQFSD